MRVFTTRLAALATFAVLLSACDTSAQKAAKAADEPNPGAAATGPSPEEQAIIDATPQVSLTPEDREKFRQIARDQMDEATTTYAKEGYTPDADFSDEMVALLPTQNHTWTVSLKSGQTYRIVGFCDVECEDLDLELIDRSGKIVERDSLPDDYPILNIAPSADAEYTVRMVMKTCTIAPCFAGSRVFRRTGAARDEGDESRAT